MSIFAPFPRASAVFGVVQRVFAAVVKTSTVVGSGLTACSLFSPLHLDDSLHPQRKHLADVSVLLAMAHEAPFIKAAKDSASAERIQTYTYDHPWEVVVFAHMLRYPLHERVPVLLESQLLESNISDSTTHQVRWLRLAAEAPKWLQKTFGTAEFEFLQVIDVDYEKREFVMQGKNLTYASLVSCEEMTIFRANLTDPTKTDFEQRSWLELPHFPFSSYVARYIVKSYDANTNTGRAIDLDFIKQVTQDGSFAKYGRYTSRPDA